MHHIFDLLISGFPADAMFVQNIARESAEKNAGPRYEFVPYNPSPSQGLSLAFVQVCFFSWNLQLKIFRSKLNYPKVESMYITYMI